jgi:hypothetical protein
LPRLRRTASAKDGGDRHLGRTSPAKDRGEQLRRTASLLRRLRHRQRRRRTASAKDGDDRQRKGDDHTHHNMIGPEQVPMRKPHTGPKEIRTSTRGQGKTRRRTGHTVIFVFKKSRGRREGRPKNPWNKSFCRIRRRFKYNMKPPDPPDLRKTTWRRQHALCHDRVLATRRVDFRLNGLSKY